MSRSNTNYFNVCEPYQHYDGTWSGIIGEDGFCDWHRDRKFYRRYRVCIPAREFENRAKSIDGSRASLGFRGRAYMAKSPARRNALLEQAGTSGLSARDSV